MPLTEKMLERLDELLLLMPDETMPLSSLDGFLTAVILSPEDIPASEWLPAVWGEAQANLFQQADIMKEATGLVMAHFNGLSAQLENPRHEIDPEFTFIDVRGLKEIIWEPWIGGFFHAVALQQEAWDAALDSAEEEASSCFAILRALESVELGRLRAAAGDAGLAHRVGPKPHTFLCHGPEQMAAEPTAGKRQITFAAVRKNRPQRPLPVRVGQEVQEMLRGGLTLRPRP